MFKCKCAQGIHIDKLVNTLGDLLPTVVVQCNDKDAALQVLALYLWCIITSVLQCIKKSTGLTLGAVRDLNNDVAIKSAADKYRKQLCGAFDKCKGCVWSNSFNFILSF